MLTQSLVETVLHLADQLPTGRIDHNAWKKARREYEELGEATEYIDRVMGACDVAYYCVKAWESGLVTQQVAMARVGYVGKQVQLTTPQLLLVVIAKYGLRSREGNPKSHTEEREAVKQLLEVFNA
jgi:hypothetical protein